MPLPHLSNCFDHMPLAFFRYKDADAAKQEFMVLDSPVASGATPSFRRRRRDFHAFVHDGNPLWHDSAIGQALRDIRSEEHTSELQSLTNLVCRLLLEKK